MQSGDTPEKVQAYYNYLQSHHETNGPLVTWHILWNSIAWEFGFLVVLTFGLLFWVMQYRTTRRHNKLTSLDRWGGYTTEASAPAFTIFSVLMFLFIVGVVITLIVGHLVWGQTY